MIDNENVNERQRPAGYNSVRAFFLHIIHYCRKSAIENLLSRFQENPILIKSLPKFCHGQKNWDFLPEKSAINPSFLVFFRIPANRRRSLPLDRGYRLI